MRRLRTLLLLLAACCLLTSGFGCASSNKSSGDFYRRGSVHRDSFPGGYHPGRHHRHGRPIMY